MSDSVRKASVTTVHEQLRSSLSADDQQRIVHQYEFVSTIAIRVNAESLERLKQNDAAAGVYQNGWNQAFLSQSTKLVFPNQAMSKFTGNNEWAVAVLDTGVDKYHSFLKTGAAQKVVSEACYSRGGLPTTDPRIDSFCPGEGFSSTAVDSGLNCTGYSG